MFSDIRWQEPFKSGLLTFAGGLFLGLTFAIRGLAEIIYFPFYLLLLLPLFLYLLTGLIIAELPRSLIVYLCSMALSIPCFLYLLSFPLGPVELGNWQLVFSHLFGGLIAGFGSGLLGIIIGVYLAER